MGLLINSLDGGLGTSNHPTARRTCSTSRICSIQDTGQHATLASKPSAANRYLELKPFVHTHEE